VAAAAPSAVPAAPAVLAAALPQLLADPNAAAPAGETRPTPAAKRPEAVEAGSAVVAFHTVCRALANELGRSFDEIGPDVRRRASIRL